MPAMAYDASRGLVVLFSGQQPGLPNDTWVWGGTDWRQIHPRTLPTGRWSAAVDYDPNAAGLLMFGGFGTTTYDDTWIFTPRR